VGLVSLAGRDWEAQFEHVNLCSSISSRNGFIIMKQKFFDTFASLHRARLNDYFKNTTPFEKFINSLIFVEAYGDPIEEDVDCLNEMCRSVNEHLDCDLYASELMTVAYRNGSFVFRFLIESKPEHLNGLSFDLHINPYSERYEVKTEGIEFHQPGKVHWSAALLELEKEATFMTANNTDAASNRII